MMNQKGQFQHHHHRTGDQISNKKSILILKEEKISMGFNGCNPNGDGW